MRVYRGSLLLTSLAIAFTTALVQFHGLATSLPEIALIQEPSTAPSHPKLDPELIRSYAFKPTYIDSRLGGLHHDAMLETSEKMIYASEVVTDELNPRASSRNMMLVTQSRPPNSESVGFRAS